MFGSSIPLERPAETSAALGNATAGANKERIGPSLVAAAAANIALWGWTDQSDFVLLLQGSAGLWLVWLSYYLWRRSNTLPVMLPIYSGVYWINYLIPVFTSDFMIRSSPVSQDAIHAATTLALIGQFLFLAGFVLAPVGKITPPRLLNLKIDLVGSTQGLFLLMFAFVPLKIALGFFSPPAAVAQLMGAVGQVGLIAMSGLLLLQLRGHLSRTQEGLLFATIAISVAALFVTGFMAQPAGLLGVMLIAFLIERRRLPTIWVAVAIVPMVLFSRIKGEFREATWSYGGESSVSFFEAASLLFDLSGKALTEQAPKPSNENLLARVDHLTAFGLAIEWTPSRIPYWGGETYEPLFTSPVPRFLWPDKPQVFIGQEYGHRYWYLDPTDHLTSVNLEQTVEMFINFGSWGVFVGMLAIGVIYRIFFAVLDVKNDLSLLLAASIVPGMMIIESNFALIHSSLVQLLIFWVAFFYSCARLGILQVHAPKGVS